MGVTKVFWCHECQLEPQRTFASVLNVMQNRCQMSGDFCLSPDMLLIVYLLWLGCCMCCMNYVSLSILVLNSLSPLWKHLLSDWWLTGVCGFFGFVLGFFKWRCGFVRVLCINFTIKLILLCDSHNKTKLWYAIIKSSWLVPKSNLSVCLKLPTHQLRNAAVQHTDKLSWLLRWLLLIWCQHWWHLCDTST